MELITKRTYLENLRKQRGYTYREMADKTGFSYNKYNRIENGRATDMLVSDMDYLAYALGVPTIQLLQAEVDYLNGKAG